MGRYNDWILDSGLLSQLATSRSRVPVATKLSARTQAKLATTWGAGPNSVTTRPTTDKPATKANPRPKSVSAETRIHILTDPLESWLVSKRMQARASSQAATTEMFDSNSPRALNKNSKPATVVAAPAEVAWPRSSRRRVAANISAMPASRRSIPTVTVPEFGLRNGNSAAPALSDMMMTPAARVRLSELPKKKPLAEGELRITPAVSNANGP